MVLTIAGFDPSSGAGIAADLRTFAAHGCYGIACITSLTVQSTRGVKKVTALAPALVSETLRELWEDFDVSATKIGMLGSIDVARAVLRFLRKNHPPNVVLDPVLRSSSGARLLQANALPVLRRMLPFAKIVTPNISEALELAALGPTRPVGAFSLARALDVAARLRELGARDIVITGGDTVLDPRKAIDFLFAAGSPPRLLSSPRIKARNTHGTGCSFASAIAANLAKKNDLVKSVRRAKQYVLAGIQMGPNVGRGPFRPACAPNS
ncbi:MAG: bifunctional hydroxymethylpyrimidine kinase/phosphomethylpyrimidine kinase [Acidobacteria bacterium]|nr:bifunctional hydroxymethylpyrimidine kinase/phosphomethylpyrimidine kinase [Acidobacteriota bacterium]